MTETSIIVRAFNEARHLPALFDAIDAQEYRDFEVILVDSGSYDRTREIAAARGAKICRISSHDFTFGYSLNVGIEAAQGRFIVIVSAHTIPTASDWLENTIPLKRMTTSRWCMGVKSASRNQSLARPKISNVFSG